MFEHDFTRYPELTNQQLELLEFVSPHRQIKESFKATVVKVHDGDTITLHTDFRNFDFPLRFLDIDAPELSEDGDVSRDWLKAQILYAEVDVVIDETNRVDKYGRLLGHVLHNGVLMAEMELQLGLAVPFGSKHEGEVPSFEKWMREVEF